jgi:signal transduction histidine kinase
MFTTLRSRLWLSYALVISIALGVVSVVLIVYIIRNPLIYRQEAARLLVVQNLILRDREKWINLRPENIQTYIENQAESIGTRILVFDVSRQLVADSSSSEFPGLRFPRLARERLTSVIRDSDGTPWLYMLRQLEKDYWLMLAVQRPNVPLMNILRDDLFLPIVGAGIIALLISLVLAYLLSKWVGDPLQRVVAAAREMPDGSVDLLKLEGPREVQDLIGGFNVMSTRIRTAQLSQRQFVANVSHELKTPITIIQGFAQAMLDGTVDTPESEKKAAHVIFDESGRMHRLVVDLLELARLDAGTFDLKHESVDMNLLLQHVVEGFSPQANNRQVNIEIHYANLPLIYGDGDRLSQVFTNLLDNALKFTPNGGTVKIRTENDASELRVDITDTGVGISSDKLPYIFERFYQVDPSRKGGEEHSAGLGLAIVREIVLAHHGTITAQSSPGQGSTFTVRLPLAMPDASTVNQRRRH